MTLVEFLAPVLKKTHSARILSLLFYKERYENIPYLSVKDIITDLKSARVPNANKLNISDVLNKCGEYVNRTLTEGKPVWAITESGKAHVKKLLNLPLKEAEIEHDIHTFIEIISKVTNNDIRDYLEEGLKCLQVNALRATVVFIWVAAIRKIQSSILNHSIPDINNAINKHDQKARSVKKIDDFSYIKDKITLLAAQELGELDKGQKEILEEALNLRNKCGHPSKYNPGIKKVSGFLEDVVFILFV